MPPRLAFFSPLPPTPTGIADYSVDVLRVLHEECDVDVFCDPGEPRFDGLPSGVSAFGSTAFEARHAARPYDLAVYQMGNGTGHAYIYPFLMKVPGLLVLHDLVLHHARAKMFLDSPEARAYAAEPSRADLRGAALTRIDEYREELEAAYPGRGDRIASAQLGTIGTLLPYAYPLFRGPVAASRLTACHNDFMVEAVRAEVPERSAMRIPMAAVRTPVTPETTRAIRDRHHLAPDEVVVASFGLLTPEKRIETVARAVARAVVALPRLRLLLVGPVPDRAALDRQLERAGVSAQAIVTGRVALEDLPAYIEASDIVVHLRYPTARETSAALLRVLAQGRATVLSDLEHLADIPEDAVIRAAVDDEEGEVLRALLRLGGDAPRRARLGARAAAFVADAHSPARCRDGYLAAIAAARRTPARA